jgi:hypothetical protein
MEINALEPGGSVLQYLESGDLESRCPATPLDGRPGNGLVERKPVWLSGICPFRLLGLVGVFWACSVPVVYPHRPI